MPALLCLLAACSGGPGNDDAAPAPSASPTQSGPPGTLFDSFHYSGPDDPALAAHGWEVRTGAGGPGIQDSWSAAGAGFLSHATAQGGKVLRLQASTDGTKQGTRQVEVQGTGKNLFTGTFAARVHFSDKPATGRNGDHVVQAFFPISPSDSSADYSELDFEYLPNGGWGTAGPRLDTVSWYRADPPDRVNHTLKQHAEGWHVLVVTAMNGTVTYSLDGKELFTSSGKYVPREKMDVHFSNWFVDTPGSGAARTWDMKVNWVYYKAGEVVSPADVQKAVDAFYSAGTTYVDTVPKA
ncbi:hypothetical protein ACS04_05045 [Streptomyces roseus]|uniref:Hydrolase n=1 Tax=Streptomyces roseus TaxID=66430 RepID=A0A0J6XU41_9ACTN|nr:hypothetical protein ACS04_05045 [Streptomyces roseus]